MDAFSQVLSGLRLNGAVFFSAEFSAPWGLSAPAAKAMAPLPGKEHLVLYHLVIEGGAVIELIDGQRTELDAGEIVVFPHGDPHHMSSCGAGNGRSRLWDQRQD